jgi:hypothetical protein
MRVPGERECEHEDRYRDAARTKRACAPSYRTVIGGLRRGVGRRGARAAGAPQTVCPFPKEAERTLNPVPVPGEASHPWTIAPSQAQQPYLGRWVMITWYWGRARCNMPLRGGRG